MNDISLPKLAVLDSEMAYREAGSRDAPVALFLHGNPTSSFIWRNIIPLVAPVAHCVAPDLIGFGQSGKPDIAYRFEDHARYLDAFIAKMGIGSAYLVVQDWGSGLAFHLAERRSDFVRGLAFMEFVRPFPTWEGFVRGSVGREIFRKFRTPGEGEKLILEDNFFVERVLPGGMRRKLSDEEMAVYRAPFPTPEFATADMALPQRNSNRRRARRCVCDDGARACGASPLDLSEAFVLSRSRRARAAGAGGRTRPQADGLPAGQARERRPFPPGGSPGDHRAIGHGLHRGDRRPQRQELGLEALHPYPNSAPRRRTMVHTSAPPDQPGGGSTVVGSST